MRKIITILFIGFITMQFTACSSKSVGNEFNYAPSWVRKPNIQGYITGLGVASPNRGDDIALQRSEAMAIARDDIARQVETKVGGLFDRFAESTGIKDKESYVRDRKSKIRTVTKQKLRGVRTKDSWMSQSGKLYMLMTLETKEVMNMLKQTTSNLKDEDIKFQRFLSEQNLRELEKELENYEK